MRGTTTFPVKWTGNRNPKTITTPSGKELTVQYMRDGFILFHDRTTGSYVRTLDNDETQERVIIVEYDDRQTLPSA